MNLAPTFHLKAVISLLVRDFSNCLNDEAETKTKAEALHAAMLGNTNNTRHTTVHVLCPNPDCKDDKFKTTLGHSSRDFVRHFRECPRCRKFTLGRIENGDQDFAHKKWKKWIGWS